jgi:quercetin dioxygenase-like cupin family protein
VVPANFRRLPEQYSFDLGLVKAEAYVLSQRYEFAKLELGEGKKKHTYRGLGLNARPEAEAPLYDALKVFNDQGQQVSVNDHLSTMAHTNVGAPLDIPKIEETGLFTVDTEACTPVFKQVLSKFRSQFNKVRLLELKPGGVLTSHIDYPYYRGIRLHAILTTNPDCWWEVAGERRQLPADGNFYWMDVGKHHAVWNLGDTSRMVLSVNLNPFIDREGQRRPYMPLLDMIDQGLL